VSAFVRPFDERLRASNLFPLSATGITVLQINVGRLCNQSCRHCHVEAGPDRAEIMTPQTAGLCVQALAQTAIPIVDITGGAPELNPSFRWLVERARALGRQVTVRSNLTVLLLPSQADLARFLADHEVEIVASLPYFLPQPTDAQRGAGVFDKSIQAVRMLNDLGYAVPGSRLRLNLTYNPAGAFLPPVQHAIEADFRREFHRRYAISFNSLYTFVNMPIGRFREFLLTSGNYERYMRRLEEAYTPAAAAGVMCRNTLSVGWDGALYDCDFNQMLGLTTDHGAPAHLAQFSLEKLEKRRIVTGSHCYGCTAGAGSGCRGASVS
jgi:radical SAM/Cys-rich protein